MTICLYDTFASPKRCGIIRYLIYCTRIEGAFKSWQKIRIGFQEDIIDALDLNEYNHITATYFLLAERRLRAQRHDLARRLRLR